MQQARAGDLDAYAVLVRRHAQMAVRTAALLGAGAEAEDVVQEALVKAYRSLGRFRDGAAFRPWLLRIVANEAHNLHRSGVRRGARERRVGLDPSYAGQADPAMAAETAELDRRVLAAVHGLPERLRLVVTCRYLLELDEAETATVLAVPRGTVKSRLSRGLAALRRTLTDEGLQPDGAEVRHG
ncbi:RNA polymerase sigma factor [Nocardioides speluncae]|uniref:RNA polymerase sigma factor n=1 Tax=Nocardioides speluncae TaxID=2670337 RepID=UPI001F0C3367|nr:RNA polymerase sigma factor [Nocardioides speluncae]